MEKNNQDGAYVIQEQGDLGLGTTAIDPKYVTENGKISIPETEGATFSPLGKSAQK